MRKKKCRSLRRVPNTLARYIEKYFDLSLKRKIKSIIQFLSITNDLVYFLNRFYSCPENFDLDMASFLSYLENANNANHPSGKNKRKQSKKNSCKKFFKAQSENDNQPMELDVPNYEDE